MRRAAALVLSGLCACAPAPDPNATVGLVLITPPPGRSAGGMSAQAPATAAAPVAIRPRSVPSRPGSGEANPVAFALATSHPVGQPVYGRSGASSEATARACKGYAGPDFAQAAFLAAGGPEDDPRRMDPDGDGYACDWDPERFRRAVR